MSLLNFLYTAVWRPYDSALTNNLECLNEFVILMCTYLMNTFMQSEHLNNTKILTLVFIGTSLTGIAVNVMVISYQVFTAFWEGIW